MSTAIDSYVSDLSAKQLDSTMIELLSTQRRCEWLVCRYLADMADDKRFRDMGWYSDIHQYAKERLDLGVKTARERVRIGRALRVLPLIEELGRPSSPSPRPTADLLRHTRSRSQRPPTYHHERRPTSVCPKRS